VALRRLLPLTGIAGALAIGLWFPLAAVDSPSTEPPPSRSEPALAAERARRAQLIELARRDDPEPLLAELRTLRSEPGAAARRLQAVSIAALGSIADSQEATSQLRTLAETGSRAERCMALNTLWARGERGFVRQVYLSSRDPLVRAKARVLAQTRTPLQPSASGR
jgi:hypothetical protein